jgi:predicted ATPase/DNA-binding SARP family transcriptional activator/DNA-binding CsgD family transcriptional regulator
MSRDTAAGEVQGLRIYLLGGFRVMVGQRAIAEAEWRLRKAKSLVKMLALASDHRYHREQLLEQLWPDIEPEAALNNLHRVIHTARHVLEPHLGPLQPSAYLRFQDDVLKLSPSLPLWIDVEQFEAARSAIRNAQEPVPYLAALELYTGDLLPEDRYEDWAIRRRERTRQSYITLLAELAQIYETRKEYNAAIEALQKLVAEEPTLEEAHLNLMRLYAGMGQRYQALRQYQQLRDALSRELDAEPAMAVQRLYQDIRSGHLAPQQEQSPIRIQEGAKATPPAHFVEEQTGQPAARHTNLPHALTSFIGREQEIAEIGRLLMQTRLMTLTGSGGSGKTRLALEATATLSEKFVDGIWLVELAALTDASFVPEAVATALDVRETSDRPLLEQLVEALRSKRMLLLFDNCEHLVDACARLADVLLRACPHLTILATSRQALGLIGEITWRVPALAAPDPDRLPPFEHLLRYDAVRLFLDRASTSRPDFALTPQNGMAVVQICRRLDGIPLAIELAAVRVKVLTVEQLAARLDDALALLVAGSRTAQQRQRTLRATCDWSYALLSEREQALFRRLSVFAGGWRLEAAEQICAAPYPSLLSSTETSEARGESTQVFDLLAQLVDKSLVVMVEREGQARYTLLDILRQYGAEQLTIAGEVHAVRRQHLEWHLALAEIAEPDLSGPNQAVWLQRFEMEHDNLRAALSWANESGERDYGLRLAGALWSFWSMRGHISEGRRWLEAALAADRTQPEDRNESRMAVRAKAFRGASVLAHQQADFERAAVLAEESLVCYRTLGDVLGGARALNNLGIIALKQGDYSRAATLCQESLALAREARNEPLIAIVLNNLGVLAADQRDYSRAVLLYEESLAQYRKLGDGFGSAMTLLNLGEMALSQGDYLKATPLYHDGLVLARENGSKELIPYGLEGLAGAAAAQSTASGYADAGQTSTESLLRSARLWGAAQGFRIAINNPLPPVDAANHERRVAAARAQCDPTAFTRAWDEGYAMPIENAVVEALALSAPPTPVSIPEEPSPPDSFNHLTPREREVAALIAAGHTNREIAAKLVISERTVDTHVARILAKLKLTSRTQITSELFQAPAAPAP